MLHLVLGEYYKSAVICCGRKVTSSSMMRATVSKVETPRAAAELALLLVFCGLFMRAGQKLDRVGPVDN